MGGSGLKSDRLSNLTPCPITTTQEFSINLNCRHLWNYLPARRLYHVITHYPQETVSYMDKARILFLGVRPVWEGRENRG